MTNQLNFLKTNTTGTPDTDDVPLRHALALFLLEDINDSLRQITDITNGIHRKFRKFSEIRFIVSFLAIFVFMISFLSFLAFAIQAPKASPMENTLFGIIPRAGLFRVWVWRAQDIGRFQAG